jgi:(1->4)-alpha-D-glucan 1-alpha-D-glucosylmutase
LKDWSLDELIDNWPDGRIKQFLIARVLALRKKLPQLFSEGDYLPLATSGPMADHIVAFARLLPNAAVIAAFWRFTGRYADALAPHLLPTWPCKQTCIVMPTNLRGMASDILRPERRLIIGFEVPAQNVFDRLPIVLLAGPQVDV